MPEGAVACHFEKLTKRVPACNGSHETRADEAHNSTGGDSNVRDFGVRYANNGDRIIAVDIDKDGRHWELIQRGDSDVYVFVSGTEVSLPHIQLDALAYEFDEDHIEGTGDIRWKSMMKDAAERAAKEPGYNRRGINRP